MPGLPLTNPRWERFCRGYVSGPTAGNATASYGAAGFAGSGTQTACAGASRLLQVPAVRMRIAELQADVMAAESQGLAKAADRLALSAEAVLGQLARLGFANILDYVGRDETGAIVVDLARIERDEAAGIVELNVVERGDGADRTRQMRVRLCDRVAPLVHLGKHFGLFTERKSTSHGHGYEQLLHLTDDELERHSAELERQLADGSPAQADSGPAGAPAAPEPTQA